jgi:LysR family transcriptional regulator of gallate degradation
MTAAPNFRRLQALLTAIEAGSIAAAARRLHVTPPALTKSLRELERDCEAQLLIRTRGGVIPTEAGAAVIRRARIALTELEWAHAELRELKGVRTGRIVVGALPFARSVLLPRALARLTAARPEIDITVRDADFDALAEPLRDGRVDFVVGALRRVRLPPSLVQEKLFEDPVIVVARKGHPLAGRRATVAALARFPWVVPHPDSPVRDLFDAAFAEANLSPPPHPVVSSSLEVLRGLLLESDRLALISRNRVYHDLKSGMLIELRADLIRDQRPVGIIRRRDSQPSPAAEALLRDIRIVAAELATSSRGRGH